MDNHVIITHFNIEHPSFPNIYEGNPSWVEYRMGIFERYCLPSFDNQTDKDFHLLVFCHPNTPKNYKDKLVSLESKFNFLKLLWDQPKYSGLEGVPSFYESILKAYNQIRKNDSNEIICSRFGTDDMVETRFNEVVKHVTYQNNIISISNGFYWDINKNVFLYSSFPTGPFVSVKSTLEDFKGDYREITHTKVIQETNGLYVMNEEPLWIQLIHGTNIWNSLEKMPGQQVNHPGEEYLLNNFGYK